MKGQDWRLQFKEGMTACAKDQLWVEACAACRTPVQGYYTKAIFEGHRKAARVHGDPDGEEEARLVARHSDNPKRSRTQRVTFEDEVAKEVAEE